MTIGFSMCGSYCTFSKVLPVIEKLASCGEHHIIPILSQNVYSTDTRFGRAADLISRLENTTGSQVLHTIAEAEPIGPGALLDVMVIAPCTGNTLAKLSCGIADTSVTLGAKAHLRNSRPLVVAVSTNDGLSNAAKNIGLLHNMKNIYFVPYAQDDCKNKPNSLVADFDLIPDTISAALSGIQLQPMLGIRS